MSRIVGIDLGTTNSLVAYMEGDQPRVIPNAEGRVIVPSIVSFLETGYVVGDSAKEQLITNAEKTVYSIKRFMGLGLQDLRHELQYFPYTLAEQNSVVTVQIGSNEFTPPEISAMILKELKKRAETFLGEPITQAVITVPAYFNDAQRQATKDAGRIAGLHVARIVNEPTAASLAHGLQHKQQGLIAVYDLGGGTFDISILNLKDGIFEVLATNGNTHLGGDDFDRQIVQLMAKEIQNQFELDVTQHVALIQNMRIAAEAAKCHLTSDETTLIALPLPEEKGTYTRDLNRTDFEALIKELVTDTVVRCHFALSDAGLSASEIDNVIMVGGATRTPLVRQMIEKAFKRVPHTDINPDEVVALGAAVQGGILAGGVQDMLLLDVTPLSLGIEGLGGTVNSLIRRNTTIPTQAKEVYTTSADNQTAVVIHVLQGERELAKDNRSLAQFNLPLPPAPAGFPRIEVNFMIDANGILKVAARDLQTGQSQSVDVKPSYGLTDDAVEGMIQDSIKFAEADVAERLAIEARNEMDALEKATVKILAEEKGVLEESERNQIEQALKVLRDTRGQSDHRVLRKAIDELNSVAKHLAEVAMDHQLKAALENKKVSEVIS
ncbi:MAG TPA: molecular chaperone DnaK [Nitrospirales bacterium]|nr:molecular chaperone DnaK [Nitrospirales bacterium]